MRLLGVVFLHHGIGDLVMAIPMLRALRAALGAGTERVVVYVKCETSREVLGACGLLDQFQIRVFNRRLALLYSAILGLQHPRFVLAPQSCGDWRMPLLVKLIRADVSAGPIGSCEWVQFDVVLPGHDDIRLHKREYYIAFVDAIMPRGVQYSSNLSGVSICHEVLEKARACLSGLIPDRGRYFVFAPGSTEREKHKRWPVAYYRELARVLLGSYPGCFVLCVGSLAEQNLLRDIAEFDHSGRVVVLTPESILSTLAIFSRAECVVSGCNGPSHLAGLVGARLVTVFGPTNPGNTGAYAENQRVVHAALDCAPCYKLEFLSGCRRPICMSSVAVSQVVAAVQDVLARGGRDELEWLVPRIKRE